jgi:multicomponent Na+:H+ antiporter subunit B
MYDSLIVRAATRIMVPLVLLLSVFMLLRGSYALGGGIIGGILASSAIILHIIVLGPGQARRMFVISYPTLATLGMITAVGWGIISMAAGLPFMTSIPIDHSFSWLGDITTIIFFDIGVYMTIFGAMTTIALLLADEAAPAPEDPEEELPHPAHRQNTVNNGQQQHRTDEKAGVATLEHRQ